MCIKKRLGHEGKSFFYAQVDHVVSLLLRKDRALRAVTVKSKKKL